MGSIDSTHYFVRTYGDLLFDLCQEILNNSLQAQFAFRSILRKIRHHNRFQKYSHFERSWVLRIACDKLIHLSHQNSIPKLEENESITARLKQLPSYFQRLLPEDQILLLLRDKHKIPYPEIATAMAIPEGSLKIRRQLALRTLEEWIWNSK